MRKRENYAWRIEMTSDHLHMAMLLPPRGWVKIKEMNLKTRYLLVPGLLCFLQLAPATFAQTPDRPDRPSRPFQNERRARWANLNDEERGRLRAAHQKAMADPAVQAARDRLRQARREFREVLRPALLKADPSLQPILEKLRPERPDRADR
jgi:hypothetical protein